MIRKTNRQRGLALATLITLVPLLLVITTVSAMLVSRVLRVQREATYRVTNTDRASSLANQLRTDAANATEVTLDEQGTTLVLVDSAKESSIEYTIQDGGVTRTDPSAKAAALSDWRFVHAKVQFSLEDIPDHTPLIWLRIEYEVELEKKLVNVAELATAIHVGDGEVQQ